MDGLEKPDNHFDLRGEHRHGSTTGLLVTNLRWQEKSERSDLECWGSRPHRTKKQQTITKDPVDRKGGTPDWRTQYFRFDEIQSLVVDL